MVVCSVDGCVKEKRANGFCVMHNARFKKYGNTETIRGRWTGYVKSQKPCSNPNCQVLVWKNKYCGKCQSRIARHGNFDTVLSRKTLEYDDNFLERNNEESHYFIGWIASDGYILEKPTKCVVLSITDKEILENFKERMGYSGEIKTYAKEKPHHKQQYKFTIGSKKMVQDFVNIGIRQKKSKTIEMPKINDKYFYHFLRGLIDGDGSIVISEYYTNKAKTNKGTRIFVFLNSASKKLLDSISERCDIKPTNMITLRNEGYDDCYRLTWTGQKALALCDLLYKDSENLRLTRKYNKYLEYKNISTTKIFSRNNNAT